jgi:UDP-N-acetyl-D-mannosaminuronic acid transferase (WecB/TagA/CpsF family)
MATATEIHLSPAMDAGVFTAGATEEAARAASEVLQEDMENHHVFFNDDGFHSRPNFLSYWLGYR